MRHLVAVLDCARPIDYWPQLHQSGGAGWEAFTERWGIWSGEQVRRYPPRWNVHARALDGTQLATWAAFRLAAEWRAADQLTLIENDVVFARGALELIARTQVPEDLALLSWFDDGRDVPEPPSSAPSIVRLSFRRRGDSGRFGCQQCVTYPRRTLERLLDHPLARDWPRPPFADRLVGRILRDQAFGQVAPCIVQHIGEASSQGWTREAPLRSPTFVPEAPCTLP